MLRPIIFLAALGVFFASLSPVPPAKGDDPKALVAVLVARCPISCNEAIDQPEKSFKIVHYLKGDEPRDAVTDFDQVKGKSLACRIAEDQPLRRIHLGATVSAGGWLVDPDKRTMFVRLPRAAIGNADFHCRVDLYGISKDDAKRQPELLIKNLLVLTVEECKDGVEGGVTFAITPKGARVIAECRKTMDLTLKVRRRETEEVVKKLDD